MIEHGDPECICFLQSKWWLKRMTTKLKLYCFGSSNVNQVLYVHAFTSTDHQRHSVVVKNLGLWSQDCTFKDLFFLSPAVQLWASYLASVCCRFLLCKMGMALKNSLRCWVKRIKWAIHKHYLEPCLAYSKYLKHAASLSSALNLKNPVNIYLLEHEP